jgi:hypothetical protein
MLTDSKELKSFGTDDTARRNLYKEVNNTESY